MPKNDAFDTLTIAQLKEQQEIMLEAVKDYDRRMSTRRGRFLLWLLRRLT